MPHYTWKCWKCSIYSIFIYISWSIHPSIQGPYRLADICHFLLSASPIGFSVWPTCQKWDFYFDCAENSSTWAPFLCKLDLDRRVLSLNTHEVKRFSQTLNIWFQINAAVRPHVIFTVLRGFIKKKYIYIFSQ